MPVSLPMNVEGEKIPALLGGAVSKVSAVSTGGIDQNGLPTVSSLMAHALAASKTVDRPF